MVALYNDSILALAAAVPHEARLADPMGSAERRSPICGSRVTVDIRIDELDRVSALGLLVRACSLGRASASLLARSAIGRSVEELAASRDALEDWLAARGTLPDWPGMEVMTPALPYGARHASIRLAFEAATEAAERAKMSRLS